MFQVVIATNVANQAVTLPGVKFVWDFCLTKFPLLDWTNGVERLDTRLCSDLEKVQRAGRAARKSPGTCIEFVEKGNKLENHFLKYFLLYCHLYYSRNIFHLGLTETSKDEALAGWILKFYPNQLNEYPWFVERKVEQMDYAFNLLRFFRFCTSSRTPSPRDRYLFEPTKGGNVSRGKMVFLLLFEHFSSLSSRHSRCTNFFR